MQKYGGMDVSEAQGLEAMKHKISRLKLLVVELTLHEEVLKAVIPKTGVCSDLREEVARCKLLDVGRLS